MSAGRKVYFVLGNAGSGKGTQCAMLAERFGLDHVSAGDLLRAEVASGSARGALVGGIIRDGRIVPSRITIELLKAAIDQSPAGGVLIDGFPRTVGQADEFVRNVSDFEFVLYFDCPEDELMRRLVGRGMTSGRSDDNVASIRKRFTTFREKCKPVVDMYAAEGRLHAIDATRGVDEIFQDLLPLFDASLATAAQ